MRAHIVALAHALRRIVRLEEYFEQSVVGDLPGVIDDHHRLGMSGAARADFLVGGIGRRAADVADRGHPYAGKLPERALRSPVAAERKIGDGAAFGIRPLSGRPFTKWLSAVGIG